MTYSLSNTQRMTSKRIEQQTHKINLDGKPSGTPWPIKRVFRPVCSNASVSTFTGEVPKIRTTWLFKSTSMFLTPKEVTLRKSTQLLLKIIQKTWLCYSMNSLISHHLPSTVCNLLLTALTHTSHFISTINSVWNKQTERKDRCLISA